MTAVSLFAGIGGIDLALERNGIDVVASVEIDKAARGVLAKHFPNAALMEDVTQVTGDQLIDAGFDPQNGIISAGWPCQGNSVAGKRGGLEDPRSGLWKHVVRLIGETGAKWFIGENVPGLLSVNNGEDFAIVQQDLAELGMGFAWRVLDAQYFGVPQRRRRVLLVGRAGGSALGPVEVLFDAEGSSRNPDSSEEAQPKSASRIIGGIAVRGERGGVANALLSRDFKGVLLDRSQGNVVVEIDPVGTFQSLSKTGGFRFDADSAGGGLMFATTDRKAVRRVTPLECERLQGFPDGWTEGQPDTARYRQLGNAVAVPVLEWVVKRLVNTDSRQQGITQAA